MQVCYKMCPFRNFKNHFKSNYLHFINENLCESAILIEFKKIQIQYIFSCDIKNIKYNKTL